MKHIVVDLEMNIIAKSHKEARRLAGMEVIEIGAVVLDDAYQEIGSFMTYVKPQYNDEIEKKYAKLTGITTEMVQEAPVFEDALRQFLSWCAGISGEKRIYQWSGSDLAQIRQEAALKQPDLDEQQQALLQDWADFQEEYGEKLGMDRALSLKDAVMYAGVDFEGRPHDALCDARNTATLLEIVRTPEKCSQALAHVIEALTPKTVGSTLGEMFNFGELLLVS